MQQRENEVPKEDAGISLKYQDWTGSARKIDNGFEVVVIYKGAIAVREFVREKWSRKEIEEAIKRYIIEHTWCWQEEHKCRADDCGAMFCKLTQTSWNEWFHEDNCADCPYGIWDEEEWSQLFEVFDE